MCCRQGKGLGCISAVVTGPELAHVLISMLEGNRNKSNEKSQTNKKLTYYKYCVCIKACYILFLCAIELHCCPETLKKNMSEPNQEIKMPEIHTRVPNVDPSTTENSPKRIHYYFLFESHLLKTTVTS